MDFNENLLIIDFLLKKNRYLAHNYLAEALLFADKMNESIENLNTINDLKSDSDISFDDSVNYNEEQRSQSRDSFFFSIFYDLKFNFNFMCLSKPLRLASK